MKKIFILSAAFFIFSSSFFAQSALTESDYQIYAEILKGLRNRDIRYAKTSYSFIILSATETGTNAPENYKEEKYDGLNRDFDLRNQNPLIFEEKIPVNYEYEFAAESEIGRLLNEGKNEAARLKTKEEKSNSLQRETGWSETGWKYFYKKYPKTNGYYRFSAIGYSRDKKFAVVTIEGKGASWSTNMEYLFRKTGDKWKLVQSGGGFSVGAT